jgi:hypothetical protein
MRTISFFVLIAFVSASYAKCEVATKESFDDFFPRFAASKDFATDRTIYPSKTIRHEYGLDSQGKGVDVSVETVVTKKMDAPYPPIGEFMKTNSMESKQKSLSSRHAVVDIYKPNSDWLLSYHFQLKGRCWYLHHIEDHSL